MHVILFIMLASIVKRSRRVNIKRLSSLRIPFFLPANTAKVKTMKPTSARSLATHIQSVQLDDG